ncbi:MMPL family transporter [Kutzneria buriramensis]|uniref:RND superfamily putative drug exporter n=1 Tax=Kutzneria buriramensis TaxID=1045776 RepID=A0A3E0H5Y7_9PSEU|nr:MMPL family transporter [Kutzneria buriramensis]REH38030.1 RND superfamily putative drug exporter [Kutzneria buriramensis]
MTNRTNKTIPRPAATSVGGSRLLRLILHQPRAVVAAAVLFTVIAGVLAVGAVEHLKVGGYDVGHSESIRGRELLAEKFPNSNPNLVVLVDKPGGRVDDPDVSAAGKSLTRRFALAAGVILVGSYWDTPAAELRAEDGRAGLILLRVLGNDDQMAKRVEQLHDSLGVTGGVRVRFGGLLQANNDMDAQAKADLATSETVVIPLTLGLLLLVFGTVVAAGVPLLIGIFAIVGTLAVLRVLSMLTDVSVFSVNLATALGLGLAVDYSLLFVSRYRDERRRRPDIAAALAATMRSAGRTILFSAATVAVALSCLLVFDQYLLRSFAYAGVAVVCVTVLGATVVVPALLVLLGDRIEKWPLPGRRIRTGHAVGRWGRLAAVVMRYPVSTAMPVIMFLLVLGAPLLHVRFGLADERVLPAQAESRQVADQLREQFPATSDGSLSVVARRWESSREANDDLADYAQRLSGLPGVRRVDSAAGSYAHGAPIAPMGAAGTRFQYAGATWLSVLTDAEPYSARGADLARAVRAVPVPAGRKVLVTGQSAQLVDVTAAVADRVPLAFALIALSSLFLLFLLTGSIVLPLQALVLNLLTLVSMFGAMVWVFQDGHLQTLLGFTPSTQSVVFPILVFCITFGLSMDYEVFVLARITEQHNAGMALGAAVIQGVSHSARVISAAAAVLCVSFLGLLTSKVSFIQFMGLGAGLAVLLDAYLVRPVLVPAFIGLTGRWTWWAPAPLRALHRRYGLSESGRP